MIKLIKATQPIADFVNMNGYTILAVSEIIWRCDNNGKSQPFIIGKLEKSIEKEPVSKPNPFDVLKFNPFNRDVNFASFFH